MSYNDADKKFYELVWDMLCEEAGADTNPERKESFILVFTQTEYPTYSYGFTGTAGHRWTFYRNSERVWISSPPENNTSMVLATIVKVNQKLAEMVKIHHPTFYPSAP